MVRWLLSVNFSSVRRRDRNQHEEAPVFISFCIAAAASALISKQVIRPYSAPIYQVPQESGNIRPSGKGENIQDHSYEADDDVAMLQLGPSTITVCCSR